MGAAMGCGEHLQCSCLDGFDFHGLHQVVVVRLMVGQPRQGVNAGSNPAQ